MDLDLETELSKLSREELERLAKSMMTNGVALSFHGKRSAMHISKKVRPRQTRREPKLHIGSPEAQSKNMLIEGENLQAMVTLYKYRGQVDLIVTDPPYNTGQYFRYNDRWDNDPNDPELGTIVSSEDGSRHTKWIKAMMPRLQIMKAMLKPSGVLAICIDDNELFHLGMMLDEVFGEKNRLAIINWQKTYSPKKANHVASATEYVLVYAKDQNLAKTEHLARDEAMNARFTNRDSDPKGAWRPGDLAAKDKRDRTIYAIQSPFTGKLHYPEAEHEFDQPVSIPTRHWSGMTKKEFRTRLEEWGTPYVEQDIGDGRGKALVLKGSSVKLSGYDAEADPVVHKAMKRARAILSQGNSGKRVLPTIVFSDDKQRNPGAGRPAIKRHLELISQGRIPWTFWADETYEDPIEIGSASWEHKESGHSQTGLNELDAIVGKGHGFQTVKPLKLIKKIAHIWCPQNGLVLDPYAGSGTTGHAILELNSETGSDRRFILVEQGSPENGDKYARTLTWQRLHNAITGDRPNGKKATPLGGGFEYRLLTKTIDAKTVLTMQRDELIDVVLTSHWENHKRSAPSLKRVDEENYQYLVGLDQNGEGYFLIWDNGGPVGSLSVDTYKKVAIEAKKANIEPPFHVYARYEMFQSPNVRFWKIPDKILADLGLNENDEYNNEDESA
ncbi:putative methyltransferase (plasmid) [Phaeobacter inhibens]|uniref:site-specific DNA-methyltransferase n=1 Tax=Phaeobacter inhibens TaxID=221822 RepID=UPI000C9C87BA|nr:site-specific DNA-methyltransferase [Phaeobacter inhibens]AUQ52693.1 putative methyltransferase [Phaeobacter inhibens]AUR22566.1 putative methyltransferase [Phaeobacter inhibens]